MKKPLVSIITSCYNHEKYVEESILSVINQTYPNIQLVVLDDGSKDKSPEIIERLNKSYDFTFIKQKNLGLPASLNKAIRNYAKGDYIKLVASDDKLPPDSIETHVNYMLKNPKVYMSFANAYKMDETGKIIGHIKGADPSKFQDKFKAYCLGNIYFNTTTVMFKKETFEKVGLYDESIPTEDIFMNRKIFKQLEVGYINKYVAYYRTHSSNSTVDTWSMYTNSKAIYEMNRNESFYQEGLKVKYLQWFYALSINYKKEALKYLPYAIAKFYKKLAFAGILNLIGLNFVLNAYKSFNILKIGLKKKINNIKPVLKSLYGNFFSLAVTILGKTKENNKGIFIFSFPRSGSTWMMNLLQSLPGKVGIFEPLNPEADTVFFNFFENRVLYEKNLLSEQDFKNHIDKLLKGKKLTRWSTNHSPKTKYFHSDSVVIKILRANFILSWFNKNYPQNKKIILLRHPGAVIASMKRSPGGWHNPSMEYFKTCSEKVFLRQYDSFIRDSKQNFEFMAIYWAFNTKALLQSFNPDSNLLITYEQLFLKDKKTFHVLESFIEEKLTPEFYESLNRISKTANSNHSLQSKSPLSNWTKELSESEKKRIQEILTGFDIHIYSMESDLANIDTLNKFNSGNFKQ